MPGRSLTIMLCITLLLTIRVASHLTDDQTVAVQAPAPQQLSSPPEAHQAAVARIQQALPTDSLSQLEALLIPDAAAGVTSQPAQPESTLPVDDKTLASLRSYKFKLDQRTADLDQRDRDLKQAEEKLHQRVAELEQLEASIQQRLKDEAAIKTKKIKRLTSVYEGMKADKAAPVIANMELVTVVKIFSLMDEKKVGKILSFLPAAKAVVISQALTRQISTVK